MNKALEQKLIGPLEESHTKEQSPKAVLWMELWARRSKMATRWARTRVWAGGWFFLEEDEVCGCKNKWRGPTWGPRGRGRAPGGARALHPRGHMVGPPGVFSVPIILKYSRKYHISFLGHLENFCFRGIFYCNDNSENRHKVLFCFT